MDMAIAQEALAKSEKKINFKTISVSVTKRVYLIDLVHYAQLKKNLHPKDIL